MRKFSIENQIGERLDLTAVGALWFNRPSGLGMSFNSKFESIANGFFAETNHDESQMEISGTLVFRKSNTEQYFMEVSDWLFNAESLKLIYTPAPGQEFLRDIKISSIHKSEKLLSSFLECETTLLALTPWYDRFRYMFEFSLDGDDEKRYDYRYDYRYPASFLSNSVEFEITGHYPGEIEITICGPVVNPYLQLEDVTTAEIYGKVDLGEFTLKSGETLFYSSRINSPGIWIISNEVKTSIIDYIELTPESKTFFLIPPRKYVRATLKGDGISSFNALMNVYKYYRLR